MIKVVKLILLVFGCLFSHHIAFAQSLPGTNAAEQAPVSAKDKDDAEEVAVSRLEEMDSLARISADGAALYREEHKKGNWHNYCGDARDLTEKGEFRKAIRAASMALFLGKREGNEDAEASAKLDLAIVYSSTGNLAKAEELAKQSLTHYVSNRERRSIQSWSNKVLADVALRSGDLPKAIQLYKKSIDFADDDLRFFARASLAQAYLLADQAKDSGEMLVKAESYLGVVDSRRSLRARAVFNRLQANLALSEGKFAEGIRLYESTLAQASTEDENYDRFWAQEGIGRAKLASGDKEGALNAFFAAIATSEKIRAKFRSEEIKSGLFGQMQQVFDEAVNLLMSSGQFELAWEVSEKSRARALLDMVRNRVSQSSGTSAFADALDKSLKITEIAALLKPTDVLLEFHVLDKKTYVWLIRANGLTTVTLDVGQAELAGMVNDLLGVIGNPKAGRAVQGAKLYDTLLKPLALKAGENLLIVPHRAMHYLPFQAMWNGKSFLIEDFAISYAPSSRTWAALMQRGLEKKGHLLALANPDLGDEKRALPGAQIEVEKIKKFFPDAETYFKADASKHHLLLKAESAKIMHIAAHAEVDAIDPLYSHIFLAGTDKSSGVLEAHEVYRMKLHGAGLVVLSACQSGLGKVSQGDEIWGFSRSFFGAGSSTVLASLWSVSDLSTQKLMADFYQGLTKTDARQALRTAQINLLKTPRYSHPYYWAAFNLVGDWR